MNAGGGRFLRCCQLGIARSIRSLEICCTQASRLSFRGESENLKAREITLWNVWTGEVCYWSFDHEQRIDMQNRAGDASGSRRNTNAQKSWEGWETNFVVGDAASFISALSMPTPPRGYDSRRSKAGGSPFHFATKLLRTYAALVSLVFLSNLSK